LLARLSGTLCPRTCGIRMFLRTVTGSHWRRFYFRSTSVFSALEVFLRECAKFTFDIDIDIDWPRHWRLFVLVFSFIFFSFLVACVRPSWPHCQLFSPRETLSLYRIVYLLPRCNTVKQWNDKYTWVCWECREYVALSWVTLALASAVLLTIASLDSGIV